MHTLVIKVPTNTKNYDNCCKYLTDECHAHGKCVEENQDKDVIPCPVNAFRCPFNYESCLSVEPDDWFKIIVLDSKPWD